MGWFRNLTTKALYGQTDEELRERYEIEARTMFRDRVVNETPELALIEVVVELATCDGGRLGVVVARSYRSSAVHEINQDGTFSRRLPYWTRQSWRPCKPRRFVRGLFLRDKNGGNIMKADSEQILQYGHSILEMNTAFRPYRTFEDWKVRPRPDSSK